MTAPTIVVIAYNRVESLRRLLSSLSISHLPLSTRLVISIDNSGQHDVEQYAEQFQWKFGEKSIIAHSQRLGLRDHVLTAGDLVNEYGSIIMLEDDLVVSPFFYHFSTSALDFYKNDRNIGGISLYNHRTNFTTRFPFIPLDDGSDVYFLQFASSWGQAWTKDQWNEFRNWYKNDDHLFVEHNKLPASVNRWPASSWLKYFSKYLVAANKYFVYPRISLSSNCGDAGTHLRMRDSLFQVPLLFKEKEYHFSNTDGSICRYDSHFEIEPEILKELQPALNGYNFDCCLHMTKSPSQLEGQYVLTVGEYEGSILSFGLNMKPVESNIIYNNQGSDIVLMTKEKYAALFKKRYYGHTFFEFYYRMPKLKEIMYLLFVKLKREIGRKLL